MESRHPPRHPRLLISPKHAGANSRSEGHALPANSSACRPSVTTISADHQLLASKSNYEILTSGAPLPSAYPLASSLRASIGKKRAQHQREEKMRRDRLKRALETLAAVLPPTGPRFPANAERKSKGSNRAETIEQAIEYINQLHAKLDQH